MPRVYSSAIRAEQAAATRERVLVSALALFEQHGYHATTIDDIAAGAGISKPTVFTAVGNKTAVLQALQERAESGERSALAATAERAMVGKPQKSIAAVAAYLTQRHQRRAALDDVLGMEPALRPAAEAQWAAAAKRLATALGHRELAPVLAAVGGHQVYRQLRRDWSPEHYESWLRETLTAQCAATGRGAEPARDKKPKR